MKKKLAVFLVLVFALSLCAAGCGNSGKVTINVLNWGDYIDEDLLDQFTEETGIEVNYQTMATNEEMLVKLEASDCIYDVCFPSDYIIEKLIEKDLLHELNKENIPNLANIDERFLDLSFDPENKYSVPYMWGTVGILYNTTLVDEPVTSWDILWDEKYKDNRLAILKESGVVQSYIVDAISIALAPILGANAAFLAPVIAIVLLTIGKIGLNAWLAARKEKRKQNEDNDKQ